jgi:gliding motility-associated-like protein
MNLRSKLVLTFTLILSALTGFSQTEVFNITAYQTHSVCDGIMHDANGGLQPYGAADNNTITLYAVAPEIQISVFFMGFNLGTGDELSVYDGPTTASPLLGTFTGTSALFETIISTNMDACLTVQFVANGDESIGDYALRIDCGIPCDYPIALIEAESDTIRICPGETVDFDGGSSTWTGGQNLASWEWDFDDGDVNTTSWPVASHTFDETGGYRVRLSITDELDCSSANIPEVIVLVSTGFVFDLGVSDSLICVGDTVLIGPEFYITTGDPEAGPPGANGTSLTWTEEQILDFGDGVYIPDNQGCFEASITFSEFGSAVAASASDFEYILINMEHSYVGDISINIICPNGQLLNIFPVDAGSSTNVGNPDQADDGNPGVGFDYFFVTDPDAETWQEYIAGLGASPIAAGEYAPEADWSELFGCPLNGTWTVEICDDVPADDGWIFTFGIQFNESFYAPDLSFTPTVGAGCAESYWTNPLQLIEVGEDCDLAMFSPPLGGDYTLTYQVVNNFGCVFTEDVQVIVIPKPDAFAGEDPTYCGSNINLEGTVLNGVAGQNYAYSWSPAELFNGANTQTPVFVAGIDTVTTVYMTTYWTEDENCSATDSLNVNLPLLPLTGDLERMFPCTFELPYTVFTTEQNQPGVTYQWSFTNSDTTIVDFGNNPSAVYDQAGTFTVVYFEPNCGLSVSQDITVTPQVCEILIPNIMTPNGDGDNDSFNVAGISFFDGSLLQVYNRWGNVVHEDPDYNGKWAATDIPDGTYYYILTVNENGQKKNYSGSLTIVR